MTNEELRIDRENYGRDGRDLQICMTVAGRDLINCNASVTVFVGPCHHGMARPQVADGGMASDMEGSCE